MPRPRSIERPEDVFFWRGKQHNVARWAMPIEKARLALHLRIEEWASALGMTNLSYRSTIASSHPRPTKIEPKAALFALVRVLVTDGVFPHDPDRPEPPPDGLDDDDALIVPQRPSGMGVRWERHKRIAKRKAALAAFKLRAAGRHLALEAPEEEVAGEEERPEEPEPLPPPSSP